MPLDYFYKLKRCIALAQFDNLHSAYGIMNQSDSAVCLFTSITIDCKLIIAQQELIVRNLTHALVSGVFRNSNPGIPDHFTVPSTLGFLKTWPGI